MTFPTFSLHVSGSSRHPKQGRVCKNKTSILKDCLFGSYHDTFVVGGVREENRSFQMTWNQFGCFIFVIRVVAIVVITVVVVVMVAVVLICVIILLFLLLLMMLLLVLWPFCWHFCCCFARLFLRLVWLSGRFSGCLLFLMCSCSFSRFTYVVASVDRRSCVIKLSWCLELSCFITSVFTTIVVC